MAFSEVTVHDSAFARLWIKDLCISCRRVVNELVQPIPPQQANHVTPLDTESPSSAWSSIAR